MPKQGDRFDGAPSYGRSLRDVQETESLAQPLRVEQGDRERADAASKACGLAAQVFPSAPPRLFEGGIEDPEEPFVSSYG